MCHRLLYGLEGLRVHVYMHQEVSRQLEGVKFLTVSLNYRLLWFLSINYTCIVTQSKKAPFVFITNNMLDYDML